MDWLAQFANALFNAPPMQDVNVGMGGEFFVPVADAPAPVPTVGREKSRKPALVVRRAPVFLRAKEPMSK